jgi:S-adenosylmethionine:tRNA ribosyltransferase-isomerase
VYAEKPGAVAAPTAGLHFTTRILDELAAKGVETARITLHVGPGTFRPVQTDTPEEHTMHEEVYELPEAAADAIRRTRDRGGRVVAVGTTTVRVLETRADPATRTVRAGEGRTNLFLHPPNRPAVVDALLTNFHLPRSTLLMLVSTFSSVDAVLAAYRLAVRERFRFYSYGDCMLLV